MDNLNVFLEMEEYLKPYMTQEDFNFILYMNNLQEHYSLAVGLNDEGIVALPVELADPDNIARVRKLTTIRDTVMVAMFKEVLQELEENNN